VEALRGAGAETIATEGDDAARVGAALAELGRRQITSVLLEGGPRLAGAFRDAGELDELRLFIAPMLIGGTDAPSIVAGAGAEVVQAAERALAVEWESSGDDLLVRARMREW
jgi:diaminohydroxyphosphoribosylaminopyrimidine deaminase / 5-amino-6-(5-phosphoribosylamino)uracil reductase